MNKDLDEVKSDRAKVKKQMRDTQDEIGILKSKIKTARNELQEYKVKFWNFFGTYLAKRRKLGDLSEMQIEIDKRGKNCKQSGNGSRKIGESMKRRGMTSLF